MNDAKPYHPAFFDFAVDGDIAVARFRGEQLTEEDNLEQLGQELFALVDQLQYLKVIADLTPVRYVTSSVLGKFITLHRKLGRTDGQLVLCHIHPDLEDVLNTSKLLTYFSTADSIEAAKEQLTDE